MGIFDNSFVSSAVQGLVRHAAGFAGLWLVAHGVLCQGGPGCNTYTSYDSFMGSIACLGAVGWSLFDKWQRHQLKT